MCIVRHKPRRSTQDHWYVVQIDLKETVKRRALQHGRYHANWWLPHFGDVKKRAVTDCRFWPEVHEFKGGFLGKLVQARPYRIEATVNNKAGWCRYEKALELDGGTLICGPFNFTTRTYGGIKENNHIPKYVWDTLRRRGGEMNLEVAHIDPHELPGVTNPKCP